MGEPVIEVVHLVKSYNGRRVVDDVSFQVPRGSIVGLLGRNGAGKTTTIRCLLGLTGADAGHTRVLGAPWPQLPGAARRVGVSMDEMAFLGTLPVRTEAKVWASSLGVTDARVDEVLDLVGLTDARGTRVKTLSTGMTKRLSLALALLTEPELLVLDEPLNGLDPDGIRWLRALLRAHADGGGTALLSSHLMAEMQQTVDEVLVLEQSLRFHGSLAEATDAGRRSLEDAFFDLVGAGAGGAR